MILLFYSATIFMLKFIIACILVLAFYSHFLPVGKIGSKKLGIGKLGATGLLGFGKGHEGLVIDGRKALPEKKSFEHLLLCAPTGKGKSTSYILPNILSLRGSLVITDMKGELYHQSAGYLESIGYTVLLLDLTNVQHSNRYNPFHRVKTEADVKRLSNAFYHMSNAGTQGTDAIWSQGAINVLEFLIQSLIKIEDPRYINIANFLRVFSFLNDGTPRLDSFMERYADEETMLRYKAFMGQEEKIRSGQMSSALACMVPFDIEEAKILTSTNDIDFSSFRKQRTALFIKTEIGSASWSNPLLSLFYGDFLNYLVETDIQHGDLPIYMLLDEFGNMRKIAGFQELIATIRSRKVSLSVVLQNISQLYEKYGKEAAKTIIANTSSVLIYPGIKDEESLKMVQGLLGKTTVETSNGGIMGTHVMTLDQIRTMPLGTGLFIHDNLYGERLTILPAYDNELLMKRAGLYSMHNQLIPTLSPNYLPNHTNSDGVSYLPFDDKGIDEDNLNLKARLNAILATTERPA